jgi:aarF domain-containing kinase
MTGKQLLDAMYIFKASRSVLAKHIALRRRQLDVYRKTSSLVKALKSQNKRFPLTSRAVSNLADRLTRAPAPEQSFQRAPRYKATEDLQVVNPENNEGNDTSIGIKPRREAELLHTTSVANSAVHPIPSEDVGARQENERISPLFDGFVSPKDEKTSPGPGRDTFSNRSLIEPHNKPVTDLDGKSDDVLEPTSADISSIPNPSDCRRSTEAGGTRTFQSLAEKQIPAVSTGAPTTFEIQATSSRPRKGELDINKQQDIFFTRPAHQDSALSSLPRVKLPEVTASAQDGNENVSEKEINQDLFYAPNSTRPAKDPVPKAQVVPENLQPSDAMYHEIFHSPRVARLLNGESKKRKSQVGLGHDGLQILQSEKKTLPKNTDEESLDSKTRTSPIISETADPLEQNMPSNIKRSAEDIADDATVSSAAAEASFTTLV